MEIFGEIEKWTMTKTKFEAMDLLNKYDIPCGPILSMKELAEEPSLRKTGTVVEVDHPKRGKYLTVGNPIKMSDSPTEVTRSPLLGEHTDEVLDELGYTREQIEALRAEASSERPKVQPYFRPKLLPANRGQSPTIRASKNRGKTMAHDKTTVRSIIDKVKSEGRTSLTAPEGKLVCDAYGIPVPQEGVAKSAPEAAKLAAGMGFPVVLKIVSPEILHKTEAGGVLVGVKSAADVEQGFATIMANAKKYNDKATLVGVQVQQMLQGGQEVIIGAVTDPSFGKLVAFGLGGILVEVLKDATFRLAPASKDDALSMLDGIQAAEILKGVRGCRSRSIAKRSRR